MHHGCMKCSICGATSSGQTHASLPSVIALFSISDLLSSCQHHEMQLKGKPTKPSSMVHITIIWVQKKNKKKESPLSAAVWGLSKT